MFFFGFFGFFLGCTRMFLSEQPLDCTGCQKDPVPIIGQMTIHAVTLYVRCIGAAATWVRRRSALSIGHFSDPFLRSHVDFRAIWPVDSRIALTSRAAISHKRGQTLHKTGMALYCGLSMVVNQRESGLAKIYIRQRDAISFGNLFNTRHKLIWLI